MPALAESPPESVAETHMVAVPAETAVILKPDGGPVGSTIATCPFCENAENASSSPSGSEK